MNPNEKFSFFLELINCNYEMSHWKYDKNLILLETTAPYPDIVGNLGFKDSIKKHITSKKKTPMILETRIGLVWIAGFLFDGHSLTEVHLIGSAFIGKDTPLLLLNKLNTYDLTVKLRASITKMISGMPVIPNNVIANYAVMLHYTLNGEKILLNDVAYSTPDQKDTLVAQEMLPDEHNGIWMNEQKLCKMFEEGNPDFSKALSDSFSISCGMKVDIADSLRKNKNNALVLLTLCSRACIKGGLHPSIAYTLNDYYGKRLEESKSLSEVTHVCADMTADYVARVQSAKQISAISPQIQSCCYYIKQHLTESLSIGDLAKRMGYTEYYFSHKFKKETLLSVNEYILKERLSSAKLLLAGSNRSIQDISDSLGFCNRSYFYSCFQKKEGISPSEYRKQHAKI